jgi:hypothetical protein
MRLTAHKQIPEAPMSDTRHLADLKFDERPLSHNSDLQISGHVAAGPQTDMIMLQKADVWMSQFKTRLNISIIALVVMWGAVSYFKSTGLQLSARSAPEPEKFLADGSADETSIPTMDVDSLKGKSDEIPVATVETVEMETVKAVPAAAEVAPKVEAAPAAVKKAAPPKASGNKSSARNQKKLKKSVASKSAP